MLILLQCTHFFKDPNYLFFVYTTDKNTLEFESVSTKIKDTISFLKGNRLAEEQNMERTCCVQRLF